jgi:hypothetical protein
MLFLRIDDGAATELPNAKMLCLRPGNEAVVALPNAKSDALRPPLGGGGAVGGSVGEGVLAANPNILKPKDIRLGGGAGMELSAAAVEPSLDVVELPSVSR